MHTALYARDFHAALIKTEANCEVRRQVQAEASRSVSSNSFES
jgi:hypothetical protein